MVALIKHDLEFILKQIEIAEAHAAGGDLATLVAGYNGNDGLTQAHLLPYGLRTVDGSYNNLLPGREQWGASDQSFPGLFDPTYINDADGDRYDFNPSPAETWYSNNDYANAGTGSGATPGPGSGTVVDADPRIISNLIVDQTLDNPAAIAAALTHAGMSGQPLMTALGEIVAAHKAVLAAPEDLAKKDALDAKLTEHGVEMDGNTVYLPNVSPDEGLSSPFNGWMTIFGQFFNHGLDLVAKGGNGTVYVPLAEDDPLYVPGGQNYIPLTRVTVNAGPDNVLGTDDDGAGPKNLTTPWVDQNQTYASTASKQVFMREYIPGPDGKPVASGLLLEGVNGGLATWADIKAQAREVLGIELTDLNVGNIPLIASDQYGNFIPGDNGYPQLVVGMGDDGVLGTADDVLREGNPAAPVSAQGVVLTGHAFLDDIAHNAVPVSSGGVLAPDADGDTGNAIATNMYGQKVAYDDELLDRHFIAGDGRVNENIALTAVHQVFHAEHNRIVEHTKDVALASMDRAFINEWLSVDLTNAQYDIVTNGDANAIATLSDQLAWDGERLFQAGRFTNEMEYQHLVFEEFGRMMQPDIDAFVFEPSADINPSIAAEFAHVVYRFGHSMLRQDIAVIEMDENGNPVQRDITLFDGFLNPVMYNSLGDAEAASGAIIRGMSRQVGSEIDEFVTDVLRNQLLGVPLDLASINIARGRDVGTPTLNVARQTFFEETGDTLLKPYESWADFALNMKNPASVINFIAAYGTHASVLNPGINTGAPWKSVEELRDAATKLVLGDPTLSGAAKTAFDNDRLDFLNAEGIYAGGTLGGLNTVDFWMGGLAEKKMAFGGMLGSTFAFVFQMTMENLQDADRFYYLSRTQGLNLLNELENNTFAELVMRNTDLGDEGSTALPGNLFSAFAMPTLEMDRSKQLGDDPAQDNPFLPFANVVERRDAAGNLIAATDDTTDAAYLRVNSNEHFIIGGTDGDDTIIGGGGDDAIWGKGGNDTIEAGYGVDKVFGGTGDDIITNAGTDIGEADFLHGNEGNDVIHGGSGLSLIFGNQGNDFIVTGPDGKEAFAGTGNDFILGGTGVDFLLGNEGNDWIEGGDRFDTLAGENSELFFNSTVIGHDVLLGGGGDTDYDGKSGDDIMSQNSEGIQRSNGMAGFDWAIHKGDSQAANSDLGIPLFETQEAFILRDRFDLVEGLSGWKKDDTLTGREEAVNTRAEATGTAAVPGPDSPLDSYSNALLEKNVDLISGLRGLVAHIERTTQTGKDGVVEEVVMDTADASDILLGGGGSDRIMGKAGNDVIDGDKWLNVRISVCDANGNEIATADGMAGKLYKTAEGLAAQDAADLYDPSGMTLQQAMFTRTLNPGQLHIVREILNGNASGDIDTAVYRDVVENYTFGINSDGSVFIEHSGFVAPDNDEGEEEGPRLRSDGRDTVRGIEKLEFTDNTLNLVAGTAGADSLTGTAGADIIVGGTGNDRLDGLGGADLMFGGAGDDTYVVDQVGDIVDETAPGSSGIDTVKSSITYTAGEDVENVTLTGAANLRATGNALANVLTGNSGANILNGREGADTMAGGAGNDAYYVDDEDDQVNEAIGGGLDRVYTAVDFALAAGSEVERVHATVDSGLALTGNAGNNKLYGAAGSDTLDGGGGIDTLDGRGGADVMAGGAGNDIYYVDDANDVVNEAVGGGLDRVYTTVDFALVAGSEVERMHANADSGIALTGNDGNNKLYGAAGTDTLNGGGGVDTLDGKGGTDVMAGGAGNDIYHVDDANDVVNEAVGGGLDRVYTTVDFTLAAGSEVERMYANADSGIALTGNASANWLYGGAGSDVLDGGAGRDSLTGGAGDDIFLFRSVGDTSNVVRSADRIVDFSAGDTIDLMGLESEASVSFSFIGEAAFTGQAGELQQFASGSNTVLAGDTNGDGARDFAIMLIGFHVLQNSDFIL